MAYDELLAGRIRAALADEADVTERKMFGGLAFLVNGNMAVAAGGQSVLMVRVHPDDMARLAATPGVSQMEMRGRPLKGWVEVDPSALTTARRLATWVDRGVAIARERPPK